MHVTGVMISASPTVVIVPGLRDHVPDHWQTLLGERLPGSITVPRMTTDKLSCLAWVYQIERTLSAITGPVILVAHSGGVMMVVHWARRHRRPIQGALLATPADLDQPAARGLPDAGSASTGWLAPRASHPASLSEHRGRQHQ